MGSYKGISKLVNYHILPILRIQLLEMKDFNCLFLCKPTSQIRPLSQNLEYQVNPLTTMPFWNEKQTDVFKPYFFQ